MIIQKVLIEINDSEIFSDLVKIDENSNWNTLGKYNLERFSTLKVFRNLNLSLKPIWRELSH